MKIRNLKTKVIGPALLLIPMACMHLGDGHHDGGDHSFLHQPTYQSSIYTRAVADVTGLELVTINPEYWKWKGRSSRNSQES